jgi:hypothetical protein
VNQPPMKTDSWIRTQQHGLGGRLVKRFCLWYQRLLNVSAQHPDDNRTPGAHPSTSHRPPGAPSKAGLPQRGLGNPLMFRGRGPAAGAGPRDHGVMRPPAEPVSSAALCGPLSPRRLALPALHYTNNSQLRLSFCLFVCGCVF